MLKSYVSHAYSFNLNHISKPCLFHVKNSLQNQLAVYMFMAFENKVHFVIRFMNLTFCQNTLNLLTFLFKIYFYIL